MSDAATINRVTIKGYMEAHQLTQGQLAELLRVTRRTAWSWCNGGDVQQDHWHKLEALGITFDRVYPARVRVPAGVSKAVARSLTSRLGLGIEVSL